ncbi:hypothetical protein QV08_04770 [Gallibacterium salpingitidis]|uniref:Tyr recombinase domain-containing protein n=1 Tax=Gallibacterium salpingitidis TaxID=505341 RepID=A0AB36E6G2_9PAST|nr:tyrosine-type recombinase/integrase [Gallibacterium salpingitidis]OBX08520.1 hypothetical protein QV08_04770 [Gallibacterium salpingitidis]OBX11624.1 hypothetical protein QV09_01835 [Gallibacterium salpingitidis]WKS99036.1 tyrosine-type recombinase/integrase [Gallibacterium salpingitidis]
MTKINQNFINKLKASGKEESFSLGHKLFLIMSPKGAKVYRYSYRDLETKINKKKNIGSADVISLESALQIALSYNSLLAKGIDPFNQAKLEAEKERKSKLTLKQIADDWKNTKGILLSKEHFKDRLARFNNHLFPILGDFPISELELFQARELIKPIYAKAPCMAEKVARDLRELGDHAVEMGILSSNHLSLIKKSFPRPKPQPNPCIKAEELPDFFKRLTLSNLDLQTKLLIEFELLTMVRAKEAAAAEWSEIDFDKKCWLIPAEKMKMKKAHCVPLSNQTIELLKLLHSLSGHKKYLFPHRSKKDKHCSSNTANQAFYRVLNYKGIMTPHGMRSLAATYLEDIGAEACEVIDACLAHCNKSGTAKVYLRSNFYERRIPVMQVWGDYVAKCKQEQPRY